MSRRAEPVRVAFLTSIRDVGKEDLNGSMVEPKDGPRYMMGIVEHAVLQCKPGGAQHGLMEVACVVTADLEKNLAESPYPLTPTPGEQWIHTLDLCNHHGDLIIDRTVHIPSTFRSLPIDAVELRQRAKLAHEERIFRVASHFGAEVIISDHYMCRIVYLHKRLPGLVLNIHPAITWTNHEFCFRGKTPTADALAMARARRGTGRPTMTGATLHYVEDEIDGGRIICCGPHTRVDADDAPGELRYRNYAQSKRRVLTEGMYHFLTSMFPELRANAA